MQNRKNLQLIEKLSGTVIILIRNAQLQAQVGDL